MVTINFKMQSFVACVFLVVLCLNFATGCKSSTWRNMTMQELLLKSDIVVYGQDREHRKLRNPLEIDSRFDVYCVLKTGAYQVPGQVIIENINDNENKCSGVSEQTDEGKMYIVGLTRTLSGFMKYAEVNPLQKTAFSPTPENFKKIVATCGLDYWTVPKTGEQDGCPAASKPRFCTKVRDPSEYSNTAVSTAYSALLMSTMLVPLNLNILRLSAA